ncbi:NUMOD4 motif-containing HNH endonuclease [Phenylobacterium sp.]|uniref:NUMOD4 motif-containing HNH endonuclease n=1 Tax=Phenylobacterium sp. TaxID=1871053 RepID=UPI0027171958|nr:NUMOD4 motif-containing HNH endonuclease [Phenylobacterium sp.]MDO8800093.1 NUMOD4 motif-containing HNH endonuclease [Phenylobacterium sp.]
MSAVAERWRPIPGWPYEVSSEGRVRRVGCEPLIPRSNGKGYIRVTLCDRGAQKEEYVHRLVCAAFHGPPPTPEHEVDHENDERGCNRESNLSWSTVAANRARRTIKRGEAHSHAKLTEATVRAIRASPEPAPRLAALYGVSRETIRDTRSGKVWKHVNG